MERRQWLSTSADARQVLICVNPTAGSLSRHTLLAELEAELKRAGYDIHTTADPAEISELVASIQQSSTLRAVLAFGGDGTASHVRNRVPLEIPLLPVPTGTECLLSGYLEQSAEPTAVRETLDRGVIVPMDLGRANNQHFLMMVSAGFDAAVARRLQKTRRGNITRTSYLQPILHTIRSYEYPELQLYCDDDLSHKVEPLRCRWLFGFNLPLYALGWQFAPQASGTDGRLDVCTFRRGSFFDGVRYLWHVVRQSHLRLEETELTRGRRLRIEAAGSGDVPYQFDGDFAGMLPVEIEVLPGALRLLVLPHVAERLGFGPAED
ncbi:MAG TPA: diacylglycerol kinase family protein [Lacipirellulaceae bacterium]|jgi:diacylglycerol kinase family enzyme